MIEVAVPARAAGALRTMAGEEAGARYDAVVREASAWFQGRRLLHINATAEGGGVAELLGTTLGYLEGDGIETRWLVIEADAHFFDITKRIHNRLHGTLGDGGPLGEAERGHYDATLSRELAQTLRHVRPGDVVVVHDPQPLGLVPGLVSAGATVVWTCHVGVDVPNDVTHSAWEFLREDVQSAAATTFSRRAYAWDGLDPGAIHVIPPCIDPQSPKNVVLGDDQSDAILEAAGVLSAGQAQRTSFMRHDGSVAPIAHRAEMIEDRAVPAGAAVIVQVSRWDALKDPIGVVTGFAEMHSVDAHLILAGPAPSSVADDPEADRVLSAVKEHMSRLRLGARGRIHLANLPTDDREENAMIVNALQRRADIVVQKSLAEGFGLTVTEAMWKSRPVVAGGVGGIRDQIDDWVSGVLVDPRDLDAFGVAIARLFNDPFQARALGAAARRRVEERYLATHYLCAYLELFLRLI